MSLLCSSPVLAAPRFDRTFVLQVDASHVGAGAVLLQVDDEGVKRPVSFFSKKFNQYQCNYSVIEKEALALIWALQHFDVYVGGGALLVVYSDQIPLTFLRSLRCPNQRLMRGPCFCSLMIWTFGTLKEPITLLLTHYHVLLCRELVCNGRVSSLISACHFCV